MKSARRRRIALGSALLVVVALAVPFIHFPAQSVSKAMTRALGRPVSVVSASVRLLPQPAIELQNVTIGEDPAFGAEPSLTAPLVIATLRVSSIWRARFEFGSISFQESGGVAPSFNLVRRANGEWNIESLVARAGSTPASPTAIANSEPKPRFPYIEVTGGRINFKAGVEKKVVALTDADFSLWLASDHEWRARLKAQPIRTDTHLSDTGRIEAEGVVRRSPTQAGGATTVELDAHLRGSQLGQLSALIYGRDRGWRGATDAELKLTGSVEHPLVEFRATVDDFRRFDITSLDSLKLAAACSGELDAEHERLSNLHCTVPYGGGRVALIGSISDLSKRSFDLSLQLEKVPVSRVLALLRRAKRDLPEDLNADGIVDAQVAVARGSRLEPAAWNGGADLHGLVLRSGDTALHVPPVSVAFGQDADLSTSKGGFLLRAEPFGVELGGTKPTTIAAQFDSAGYRVSVAGPLAIQDALRAARLIGMRAPTYHVRGEADVQLLVSGAWAGFAPPVITGSAQIKNASAQLTGLRAPLRIASAEMELTPTIAALRKMTASLGQAGPSFSGSIQIPRGCGHPEECIADVDLRTAELNPDSLAPLLASDAHAQWYRFFASQKAEQPSLLMRARANGHVAIDRLCTATLEATNVNAEIALNAGHLQLSDVRAHLLGGTQLGEWRADFTGTAPKYSGQGTIMRAAMSRLPATGVLPCCSGTVNLTYSAHFTGKSRAELLESATAEASFTWNNGALNRFSFPFEAKANHPAGIAAGSPLRFSKFSGTAELRDGAVQLTRSKIVSAGGIYQVSGTLTFDRHLVMTFASTSQRYIVGGTLDEPLIAMEAQRAASRAVPTPPAPAASPSPAPSAALVKAGPGAN